MANIQPTNVYVTMVSTNCYTICNIVSNWIAYKKLQYPTYVKVSNFDDHIKVFKATIKTNGETMEVDIINMFGSILKDGIF